MKVAELMTTNVRTCTPHDTLSRAAQIMWENDCGAVPIIGDSGRAIGILTDRDICMAAYTQGKPLSAIRVSSAAAHSLISAEPEDSIEAVEALMQSAQVRRVPVVDGDGRPIGIVSLGDLARHLSESHAHDGLSADPIARTLAAISQAHAPAPVTARGAAYHVRSIDGSWEVFDRDGARVSQRMSTQGDAVIHAKELARRAGSAQIIVHDERGRVVSEFFYQRDERSALAGDDGVPTMAASHPAHVH